MTKINHKKINLFLKDLNGAEYRYLALTMQIVDGLTNLIAHYKLSKTDFCRRFEIKESKYTRGI